MRFLANPERGEVAIQAGGEEKILRFNLNALATLQSELEADDMDDMLEKLEAIDFHMMKTLVWAGLIHSHKDENGGITITKDEVGDWVGTSTVPIKQTIEDVVSAIMAAMGVTEEEAKNAAATLPDNRAGRRQAAKKKAPAKKSS